MRTNLTSTQINDHLEIVYPTNPTVKNYWAGEYSVMTIHGKIEKYVLSLLISFNLPISIIIDTNDGFKENHHYYNVRNSLKNQKNILIIGALATRNINFKNILLLPLDDKIFQYGLTNVLSKIKNIPWEQKEPKIFWRGGTSGGYPSIRTKITEMLLNNRHSNVKLTFGDWNKSMPIPSEHFGDRCNLEKHFKFKYILIIDGNCIASNHEWVFGSGSVPVMVTHPDNNFWFKELLKPMVNYVPIKYDLSDLNEKINWLVTNDEKSKEIMRNAMTLAKNAFSHEGQCDYLKYKVKDIVVNLNKMSNLLEKIYSVKCSTPSDIHEHLPTLLGYVSNCNTIVECGVRNVCSSYSFAKGLKGKINNKFVMIDVYKSVFVDPFLELCITNNVNASFVEASDLECELIETDMLFIDTWHIYGQLRRELNRWNKSVKRYIILHDTTTYEWVGEESFKAEELSISRNMPVDEIMKGLWYAVDEFLKQSNEWVIEKRFTNNNGLTILARKF